MPNRVPRASVPFVLAIAAARLRHKPASTPTGEVVQVEFLSSIGGSYMIGIMGTASITFGDLGDGRVRANVDANLARSGGGDLPLQMALDVGVERFIFPPSLSCPRPD